MNKDEYFSSPIYHELKKEWVFWFFRVNFHGVGMRYFPDELVGNALGFFPKFTILVKFGGGSVITGRLIKCFPDFYEISLLVILFGFPILGECGNFKFFDDGVTVPHVNHGKVGA